MAAKMCNHGNCPLFMAPSEMICITKGGVREHYCSWIHAALGCLHHIWSWDRRTRTGKTVYLVEAVLGRLHERRQKEEVSVR